MTMAALRGKMLWAFHFIFRAPEEQIRPLLPAPLEPILHHGWAFWNVEIHEAANLRPAIIPVPLGAHGHAIAYRILAQYPLPSAEPTPGLYAVRSDGDNPVANALRRSCADLPCHLAGFDILDDLAGRVSIEVDADLASVRALLDTRRKPYLPGDSPFDTASEAARFLQAPPRMFHIDATGNVRCRLVSTTPPAERKHRLIHIDQAEWEFFQKYPAIPEICYEMPAFHCTLLPSTALPAKP